MLPHVVLHHIDKDREKDERPYEDIIRIEEVRLSLSLILLLLSTLLCLSFYARMTKTRRKTKGLMRTSLRTRVVDQSARLPSKSQTFAVLNTSKAKTSTENKKQEVERGPRDLEIIGSTAKTQVSIQID